MIAHPVSVRLLALATLPFLCGTAQAEPGRAQSGIASVYSYPGSKTASGERANRHGLTAAHRTLPFGTRVRVTNKRNGKSVVVRINDRGPFHEGRVIDLSYAAAVKLGIVARGTGRVEVRALTPGEAGVPSTATAGARQPATDRAAAVRTDTAQTSTAALPATGMDNLVQELPSSTGSFAPAAAPPSDAAPRATPAQPGAVAAAASVPATGAMATAAVAAPAPASTGPVLQVASFSSLDNARRALERLLAAGIAGARLDDAVHGGRPLWRLRVAADGVDAMELAGRIAGLGFGTPQLVRD